MIAMQNGAEGAADMTDVGVVEDRAAWRGQIDMHGHGSSLSPSGTSLVGFARYLARSRAVAVVGFVVAFAPTERSKASPAGLLGPSCMVGLRYAAKISDAARWQASSEAQTSARHARPRVAMTPDGAGTPTADGRQRPVLRMWVSLFIAQLPKPLVHGSEHERQAGA